MLNNAELLLLVAFLAPIWGPILFASVGLAILGLGILFLSVKGKKK